MNKSIIKKGRSSTYGGFAKSGEVRTYPPKKRVTFNIKDEILNQNDEKKSKGEVETIKDFQKPVNENDLLPLNTIEKINTKHPVKKLNLKNKTALNETDKTGREDTKIEEKEEIELKVEVKLNEENLERAVNMEIVEKILPGVDTKNTNSLDKKSILQNETGKTDKKASQKEKEEEIELKPEIKLSNLDQVLSLETAKEKIRVLPEVIPITKKLAVKKSNFQNKTALDETGKTDKKASQIEKKEKIELKPEVKLSNENLDQALTLETVKEKMNILCVDSISKKPAVKKSNLQNKAAPNETNKTSKQDEEIEKKEEIELKSEVKLSNENLDQTLNSESVKGINVLTEVDTINTKFADKKSNLKTKTALNETNKTDKEDTEIEKKEEIELKPEVKLSNEKNLDQALNSETSKEINILTEVNTINTKFVIKESNLKNETNKIDIEDTEVEKKGEMELKTKVKLSDEENLDQALNQKTANEHNVLPGVTRNLKRKLSEERETPPKKAKDQDLPRIEIEKLKLSVKNKLDMNIDKDQVATSPTKRKDGKKRDIDTIINNLRKRDQKIDSNMSVDEKKSVEEKLEITIIDVIDDHKSKAVEDIKSAIKDFENRKEDSDDSKVMKEKIPIIEVCKASTSAATDEKPRTITEEGNPNKYSVEINDEIPEKSVGNNSMDVTIPEIKSLLDGNKDQGIVQNDLEPLKEKSEDTITEVKNREKVLEETLRSDETSNTAGNTSEIIFNRDDASMSTTLMKGNISKDNLSSVSVQDVKIPAKPRAVEMKLTTKQIHMEQIPFNIAKESFLKSTPMKTIVRDRSYRNAVSSNIEFNDSSDRALEKLSPSATTSITAFVAETARTKEVLKNNTISESAIDNYLIDPTSNNGIVHEKVTRESISGIDAKPDDVTSLQEVRDNSKEIEGSFSTGPNEAPNKNILNNLDFKASESKELNELVPCCVEEPEITEVVVSAATQLSKLMSWPTATVPEPFLYNADSEQQTIVPTETSTQGDTFNESNLQYFPGQITETITTPPKIDHNPDILHNLERKNELIPIPLTQVKEQADARKLLKTPVTSSIRYESTHLTAITPQIPSYVNDQLLTINQNHLRVTPESAPSAPAKSFDPIDEDTLLTHELKARGSIRLGGTSDHDYSAGPGGPFLVSTGDNDNILPFSEESDCISSLIRKNLTPEQDEDDSAEDLSNSPVDNNIFSSVCIDTLIEHDLTPEAGRSLNHPLMSNNLTQEQDDRGSIEDLSNSSVGNTIFPSVCINPLIEHALAHDADRSLNHSPADDTNNYQFNAEDINSLIYDLKEEALTVTQMNNLMMDNHHGTVIMDNHHGTVIMDDNHGTNLAVSNIAKISEENRKYLSDFDLDDQESIISRIVLGENVKLTHQSLKEINEIIVANETKLETSTPKVEVKYNEHAYQSGDRIKNLVCPDTPQLNKNDRIQSSNNQNEQTRSQKPTEVVGRKSPRKPPSKEQCNPSPKVSSVLKLHAVLDAQKKKTEVKPKNVNLGYPVRQNSRTQVCAPVKKNSPSQHKKSPNETANLASASPNKPTDLHKINSQPSERDIIPKSSAIDAKDSAQDKLKIQPDSSKEIIEIMSKPKKDIEEIAKGKLNDMLGDIVIGKARSETPKPNNLKQPDNIQPTPVATTPRPNTQQDMLETLKQNIYMDKFDVIKRKRRQCPDRLIYNIAPKKLKIEETKNKYKNDEKKNKRLKGKSKHSQLVDYDDSSLSDEQAIQFDKEQKKDESERYPASKRCADSSDEDSQMKRKKQLTKEDRNTTDEYGRHPLNKRDLGSDEEFPKERAKPPTQEEMNAIFDKLVKGDATQDDKKSSENKSRVLNCDNKRSSDVSSSISHVKHQQNSRQLPNQQSSSSNAKKPPPSVQALQKEKLLDNRLYQPRTQPPGSLSVRQPLTSQKAKTPDTRSNQIRSSSSSHQSNSSAIILNSQHQQRNYYGYYNSQRQTSRSRSSLPLNRLGYAPNSSGSGTGRIPTQHRGYPHMQSEPHTANAILNPRHQLEKLLNRSERCTPRDAIDRSSSQSEVSGSREWIDNFSRYFPKPTVTFTYDADKKDQ